MTTFGNAAKTRKPGLAYVAHPTPAVSSPEITVMVQRTVEKALYYVNGKPFDMAGYLISSLSYIFPGANITKMYDMLFKGEYTPEELESVMGFISRKMSSIFLEAAFASLDE